MGCLFSSSSRKKKKQSAQDSKTQKGQELNGQKDNDSNAQKKADSHQNLLKGTDLQSKIPTLKDTKVPSNSQAGSSQRQLINKQQNNRDEAQELRKSATKNPNQKPQATDNKGEAPANQEKPIEVGRILDDELLKDLAKYDFVPNKAIGITDQDVSDRMKDSVALDFDNLKSQSPIFESGGAFDLRKDDPNEAAGDKSLTLNLTDLKIEHHQ